jgi:CheY-like chemotaxis protein
MNGLVLGATLRRTPSVATSPIILISDGSSRPTGTSSDFAAVLALPLEAAALRDAISDALSRELQSQGPGRTRREPLVRAARPLRILLAEDHPVNQRVAQLMLERLGHSVDTVSNGRAAVDAVTNVPYDVVLMDVHMPEMDGLETTRRIRARLGAEQQPYIVGMTANVMPACREACSSAGMEDYLSKPVRVRELEQLLTRIGTTISDRSATSRALDPEPV